MESIVMALVTGMRLGRTALPAAFLWLAFSTPGQASFSDIVGSWTGDAMAESGVACAPDTLSLEVSGTADSVAFSVIGASVPDMTLEFAREDDTAIFTEKTGWMKRFGLSDTTTRDRLIDHEPIAWAREIEDGAVVYRAQIDETGGLVLFRGEFERVEGGVFAQIEIDEEGCITGPINGLLSPR